MRKPRAKPKPRRKNRYIDQGKLEAARALLGTDSDTATIDAALDSVLFADEVIAGLRGLASAGGLEYFDDRDRPQP